MRRSALFSALAKVLPYILAAIACIAGVVRTINSDTSTPIVRTVFFICLVVGVISILVALTLGGREYERVATIVLATLKTDHEHGGGITRYRLAAQSSGVRLLDVKVTVQEPCPNWPSQCFPGHALHFPYRLQQPDIAMGPEGCSINPKSTEFFDLLRWWISASGVLQVQLNNQTFQAPNDPWALPLRIEWSEGYSEIEVQIRRDPHQLELSLNKSVAEQQKHALTEGSKWSRSEKWAAAGAMIPTIGIAIVLSVPGMAEKLGLQKPANFSSAQCQNALDYKQEAIPGDDPMNAFGQHVVVFPKRLYGMDVRLYVSGPVRRGFVTNRQMKNAGLSPTMQAFPHHVDILIKDPEEFMRAKSVDVYLYGPDPFSVTCVQVSPVPLKSLLSYAEISAELANLEKQGSNIQSSFANTGDVEKFQKESADWSALSSSFLGNNLDLTHMLDFQNTHGSSAMACPSSVIQGCDRWRDMQAKRAVLTNMIEEVRKKD
jgi:hypothetical protein